MSRRRVTRFGLGNTNHSRSNASSQFTGYNEKHSPPPRPGSAGFGASRPLMLKLAELKSGSRMSIRWRPVVIPGDAKYGDSPPRGQRVLNVPDFAHRASWNEVLIAASQSLGFTLTTGHHQTRCDCVARSWLYLLSIFIAIVSGSGLTLQLFLPISVGNLMFGAL
jgi:hypothetical protein